MKRHGRKYEYTDNGIKRLPCARCGVKPSLFQWSFCSDNNLWRPICLKCDIDMNRKLLKYMNDPDADIKMDKYMKFLKKHYGEYFD